VAWTLKFKLKFRLKFRLKLSIANMLERTTTEEVKNAVAGTLKFKLKFKLKLSIACFEITQIHLKRENQIPNKSPLSL